jgi:ABC-type multidrug transport system fused ATPase/permease subunit
MMMDPASRICELLDTRSKIEPDPEQPREGLLRPETFAGKIEFKGVHFNYPSIKDKVGRLLIDSIDSLRQAG